jgi:hypothetical protein
MSAFLIAGLKGYAFANLSLAIAWAVFRAAIARTSGIETRIRYQHWLRLAQVSLVLALLAGLAAAALAHWVPAPSPIPYWRESGLQHGFDLDGSGRLPALARGWQRAVVTHAPRALSPAIPALPIAAWLGLFLFSGYAVGIARLLWHCRSLRRLIRSSVPLKHRGRLRVLVSDETQIPFSVRLVSTAYVILPLTLLGNRKDVTAAVHHEIQHHRNGDTRWIHLIEMLKVLLFWNPAIYLWARQMAQLQELACDEAVITRRPLDSRDYGFCLLRVAQATLSRPRALLGTAGMSHTQLIGRSFLMRRISMLTQHARNRTHRRLLALVAGSLGAAIAAMTLAGGALLADPARPADRMAPVNPVIQDIADRALADAVRGERADAAFSIVSDARNGQVLAIAYQSRAEAKDPAAAIARYLSQPAEPWSLIKPLVAAMAIDGGKTDVDESHDCQNGRYTVGNKMYTDREPVGHMTTAEMVIHSSNVCSIKVAETLGGGPALAHALTALGFGPGSVVGHYPAAGPGILAPAEGQKDPNFVANAMFGIGLRVTPLELVQAYGAIANGGTLLEPLAYGAEPAGTAARHPFSPVTAAKLRGILFRVVTEGTGRRAELPDYTTAGKTGTGSWERVIDGRDHSADKTVVASFTGFAPVSDPRLVIYVTIENPRHGEAVGGVQAAPVFAKIADRALTALAVAPDKK